MASPPGLPISAESQGERHITHHISRFMGIAGDREASDGNEYVVGSVISNTALADWD
jgi:hypothetical protein